METNNLENIIAPVKINIEIVKWDKMRWASLIFIVGFAAAFLVYFGYWYATDWQQMKDSLLLTEDNSSAINDFCPFNEEDYGLCPIYTLNNITYDSKCLLT